MTALHTADHFDYRDRSQRNPTNQTGETPAQMSSSTAVPSTVSQPITSRLRLLRSTVRELARSARRGLGGPNSQAKAALKFVRAEAVEGDAESVLGALDRFARKKGPVAYLGARKGRALDKLVATLPANARILELGTYFGYSTIRIARLLRSGGQVLSIEAQAPHARVARAMCRFAGVEDQVRILPGEASELMTTLAGPFDLVLMDHKTDEYLIDLWHIETARLLKPGSTIVANIVGPRLDTLMYRLYVRDDGSYNTLDLGSENQNRADDNLQISVWQGTRKETERLSP